MRRLLRDPLPLLAVLIGALLAGLALLQHRWLAAVSAAERTRMRTSAAGRAEAFAHDLDRELTRAFLMLGVDAAAVERGDHETYAQAYASWKARAAYPDLVADVWLVEAVPRGGGEAHVRRFDPASGRFVDDHVPAEMTALVARLTTGGKGDHPGLVASLGSTDVTVPAVLIPAPQKDPLPEPLPSGARDHVFVFRPDMEPATWSVVRIDRQALDQRILPDLARKHVAGGDGLEYHVTISAPGVGGAAGPRVVWRSDPAAPGPGASADATASAFSVRFDDIDSAILANLAPERARPTAGEMPGETPHTTVKKMFALRITSGPGPGGQDPRAPWTIALSHRAGSVEAAVAATQRRSAAVAGAVLLLLGGSAALVIVSARRERRLAGRQLEFVAAVSHELRTPLTVIRSAAENLRDGLVVEPSRVREYGAVLREEGRRLTDMVEQVLAFAGADSAGADRGKAVDVERLVQAAVADAGLEAAGIEAHVEIEPGLHASGDEATLAAALRNLLVNLRKYAAEGRYAKVAARAAGSMVEIVVEDRGPGLGADEVRRVFEPFFRGRSAAQSLAPGSGIGLALVRRIAEAHGGSVEARPLERGIAFVLRVPAAAPADAVPERAPAREEIG
ncbi:MAG TPA: HAMP domain-containing sensor histidine kinase [Vicinamibacteria bacterium]|nr:HAMP domain-containing sensor histidine kinase [Vicinamibacteria bacterium]